MKGNYTDNFGVPMVHVGSRGVALFSTTLTPVAKAESDVASNDLKDSEFVKIGNAEIAGWFDKTNTHPADVRTKYLKKSSVLKSAIGYKRDLAVAQGIFGMQLEGIDSTGKEILKSAPSAVNTFLSSRPIRKMQQGGYYNLYAHGNAAIHIVLGRNAKEISIVESLDAPFFRYGRKKQGALDLLYYTSKWGNSLTEKDLQKFKVVDTRQPLEIQIEQAKKYKSFIYPLDFKTSGSIYYADEPWSTAMESGHLDITLKAAKFTESMFDNQMSIKYHVKIPYAYWEKIYPTANYPTPEDLKNREDLITKRLDEIEEELCSSTSARKTIFTHYTTSEDGKINDAWIIDVLDDKLTSQHYLPQTAASNAEVFTSMGVNPSVKGLSMAAGPYANQSGGSNIREAFLVDSALAWGDRQEVIDPVNLMLGLMGYPNISVRTKEMVLTTLDTGGGTSKKIS